MTTRATPRITLGVLAALIEMALLRAGAVSGGSDVAIHLKLQAAAYAEAGEYSKGEVLYRQALAIEENVLAPDSPVLAEDLTALGGVLYSQARYADAEPLCRRALPFASTFWARTTRRLRTV